MAVAVPNILLCGPAGLGKTHLALAVSRALNNRTLHVHVCNRELTPEAIGALPAEWKDGDLVFLDEAHSLSRLAVEKLYPTLTEQRVTVIAATDRPGSLPKAFKNRFGVSFVLEPYGLDDMTAIVRQRATEVNVLLTPQSAKLIARMCRGTPRKVGHCLRNLVSTVQGDTGPGADATTNPRPEYTATHIRIYRKLFEIDKNGLTKLDLSYLRCLSERPDRGTSLQVLELKLHCDKIFLLDDVEPFLVQLGLIDIDRRGRFLTPTGREYIQ